MPRRRLPDRRQAETVDLWHGGGGALAAGLGKLGNGQGPASLIGAIAASLVGRAGDKGVIDPYAHRCPVGGMKNRIDSGNKMRRNSTCAREADGGGSTSDRAGFSERQSDN